MVGLQTSTRAKPAPPVVAKKNITEIERKFQNTRPLLIELTKKPQPILQSLGSEGDAVVSFWSFMVVLLLLLFDRLVYSLLLSFYERADTELQKKQRGDF